MERREFLRHLTLNLAAGWACGRLSWPVNALAGAPELRLALLADAHLRSGDAGRPEAVALARAVAQIRALTPAPDLALFAGDLAHKGRPDALDLGKEILSDLPAPVWTVRGESDDGRQGAATWVRRFGPPWFSRAYGSFHLLGLDTALHSTAQGPGFAVGLPQRQWLAAELARLDPATPLIVVSHAPLARLFHPWQQWTIDAAEVTRLLDRFPSVLCLHGHVHGAGVRGQGPGIRYGDNLITHYALPATAWPRPYAVEGTPAFMRSGSGPRGCGWVLLTFSQIKGNFQPYLWQA